MPLYTYQCKCGFADEYLLSLDERHTTSISCEKCGKLATRIMDITTIGKPAYQMQAVMDDGSHVPGQFGKAARKR